MKKKCKKLGLIIWSLLQVFIIVYVLLVTGFILCKNSFGYTQVGKVVFLTINEKNHKYIDDSEVGELVVIREDKSVKKGDVIYYYSVVDEQYVIKSDFVKDIIEDESVFVLDNELGSRVTANRLIGTTISSYAYVGDILDLLTSSVGFLIFVLLPIMFICVYKVYELIEIVNNEKKILNLDNDIEII